jgi:predicted Fe-Mo cluster-binding NifX family protein
MNIVIPILNDCIAPRFEAARKFAKIQAEGDRILSTDYFQCEAQKGFILVKLLEIHETNVVLCNGIKDFLKDQLNSMGIVVITDINDKVENVVNNYLRGEIAEKRNYSISSANYENVLHDDLVCWAKEIFELNGFSVVKIPENDFSLIDLVAKVDCPVCGKKIQVAVCCGAQTYRIDREITEFANNARGRYNSLAYVYMDDPAIEPYCNKYGIEYLRPDKMKAQKLTCGKSEVPILRKPIEGHEKLQLQKQQ